LFYFFSLLFYFVVMLLFRFAASHEKCIKFRGSSSFGSAKALGQTHEPYGRGRSQGRGKQGAESGRYVWI